MNQVRQLLEKRFHTTQPVYRIPETMKLLWYLTIAGSAFVIAALFLVNWLKRAELHARE